MLYGKFLFERIFVVANRLRHVIPVLQIGLCCSLGVASAQIRLPKIISDHSVLQRQVPIHIWGWASAGEQLTVTIHEQSRSTIANQYGEWSAWLQPEQAGGPYTLTVKASVSGGEQVTISDVLIGDVWVASGQSNMEMPLRGFPGSAVVKNADREIASANQPKIRLLRVEHKTSDIPVNDITSNWTLCTPETAAEFSAVAYFFGRDINRDEKVPVGLIDSTWGGTPIEAWMSLDALGANPQFMPVFASRAHFADEQSRLDQIVAAEKGEDAAALEAHRPLPKHPWHPAQQSWLPAALYNGMISPLTPYSIKGFLWYQGETNSKPDRSPLYSALFPAMISDWRTQWAQGNLPFLYVQISSFRSDGENWGEIRNAQRRTLAVTNTAMAVSIDVGDPTNVHPADKQTVGTRLALAARGMVYSHDGEYSGPTFRQATTESEGMRVWFDHASGGLRSDGAPLGSSVSGTSYQSAFELAGDDHNFVPARAIIDGETVMVTSPVIHKPRYVRYAWANESTGGLYNKQGLPAPTFTSE
jgi:sialate O-acetylesterase